MLTKQTWEKVCKQNKTTISIDKMINFEKITTRKMRFMQGFIKSRVTVLGENFSSYRKFQETISVSQIGENRKFVKYFIKQEVHVFNKKLSQFQIKYNCVEFIKQFRINL